MAQIRTNKVDAARRQIDAAIRMLFGGEDVIAVYSVAAAGSRILRDIADKKGASLWDILKPHIKEGKEKEFWAAFNRPANFFKHADRDADEILEGIDERAVDFVIWEACIHYGQLGYKLTEEMQAFNAWFLATNPEVLRVEEMPPDFQKAVKGVDFMLSQSRAEQLTLGNGVLKATRALRG